MAGEHKGDYFVFASPLKSALDRVDNLIITPHIGGATVEAWGDTEVFIANKVKEYYKV